MDNFDDETVEYVDHFEIKRLKHIEEQNNLATRKNYEKLRTKYKKSRELTFFPYNERMKQFYEKEIKNCTQEIERVRSMINTKEKKINNLRQVTLKIIPNGDRKRHSIAELQREINALNQQNHFLEERIKNIIYVKNLYMQRISNLDETGEESQNVKEEFDKE